MTYSVLVFGENGVDKNTPGIYSFDYTKSNLHKLQSDENTLILYSLNAYGLMKLDDDLDAFEFDSFIVSKHTKESNETYTILLFHELPEDITIDTIKKRYNQHGQDNLPKHIFTINALEDDIYKIFDLSI